MIPTGVIIDTDMGVDDALAVVLAANSPELRVDAITTVAGNAEVGECTRNSLLLAEALWPDSPPPVAQGATAPLEWALTTAPEVHGADGLGGEAGSLPEPRLGRTTTPARELLVRLATREPGGLVLVATGPLTNLAAAMEAEPDILSHFRRIVLMGGAFSVPGNTGPYAEFNFYVDPHAADTLMRSGVDVTVVPLDVTTTVELARGRLERFPRWAESLAASETFRIPVGKPEPGLGGNEGAAGPVGSAHVVARAAIARAVDYYIRFQREESNLDAGYMHDPVTLASAVAPGLLGTREIPVRIITDGPERGRSVEAADGRPPVKVAFNADRKAILELLSERVLNPLFG